MSEKLGFWAMIGSYFVDPASPTVVSSKRVNGLLAFIAAVVLAFTVKDVAIVGAFLGLVGVEGVAVAISKR